MNKNFLQEAQKLMLDDNFNRIVESRSKGFSANNKGREFVDTNAMEQALFGYGDNTPSTSSNRTLNETKDDDAIDFNAGGAKKLPTAIRESFMNNPTPKEFYDGPASSLEEMAKQLKLSEQVSRQYQPQQVSIPQGNGVIDYALIKTIVNEAINEKLGNMLNESAGSAFRGMKFIDGNKIQFLDSKGNLYEGVMKLKKRAK